MSDEVGSSRRTSGDRKRKGKEIMYSDDVRKQTGEQNSSGFSDAELASLHVFAEGDGGNLDDLMKQQQHVCQIHEQIYKPLHKSGKGKPSQKELWLNLKGETNIDDFDFNPFIIKSSQKEPWINLKGENNIDDFDFGPFTIKSPQTEISVDSKDKKQCNDSDFDPYGSDSEDEKNQALQFELEIFDSDRLVIPKWMMDDEFPLLMFHADSEETLQLTDKHDKKWSVTLTYDNALNSYIITTGWSSYLQHYQLTSQDMIRCYRHVPQLNSNHFRILHQKKYGESQCLFKVVVSRSNRLRIFFDRVEGHFNSLESPPKHLSEYTIYVTDQLNQTWEMRLLHFAEEEAYVVVRGWEQYVARHGLVHQDKIVFCRPNNSRDRNRFLIYHELRCELGSEDHFALPLFLSENILCDIRLSEADVGFGRLMMPAVEIPSLNCFRDMVKLTDENDKEWFMILVQVNDGYMIIDGWEGYVKEYELKAGDRVRLYNPVSADHDNHFLIVCEKKKQKRTGNEEGESRSANPSDGAAPSQSGSRKGKEKMVI